MSWVVRKLRHNPVHEHHLLDDLHHPEHLVFEDAEEKELATSTPRPPPV